MTASSERGKRTTILYFNLFTWLGGGEYSVYYLVKNISRAEYRPFLLFNAGGPFPEKAREIDTETAIIPFDIVEPLKLLRPGSLLRNLKASLEIKRLIRQERVDVIHCSDVFALLLLLPSLVSNRIPVVYSVIVFYGHMRSLVLNLFAFFFIRQIVTNSGAVKDDLLKKTIGLRGRTSVAFNGVDTSVFYPRSPEQRTEIRRKAGLPLDKRVVGFVGRFEVWKGHSTFLRAARELASSRQDLSFLIVGGAITKAVAPQVSRYEKETLELLSGLELDGRVVMFDHRNDIPELMASLDVYVCSSDYEPYGLVVLEALASGIPVVASRSVGALEAVGDDERVFVAEPRDPASFARQVESALSYADGKAPGSPSPALESFRQGHSWRNYALQFEARYQAAIQS